MVKIKPVKKYNRIQPKITGRKPVTKSISTNPLNPFRDYTLTRRTSIRKKLGLNFFNVMDDMMEHDQISSALNILVSGIVNKNYSILSNDDKIKEIITNKLKDINWIDMLSQIEGNAFKDGFSAHQIIWEKNKQDNIWFPKRLELLDPRLVELEQVDYGQLKYNNILYPIKTNFLVYRNNYNTLYTEGRSIVEKAYWYWLFQKECWSIWMRVLSRYADPALIGLMEQGFQPPTGWEAEDWMAFQAEQMALLQSEDAYVASGMKEVKPLELKQNSETFEKLIDKTNHSISKIILSSYLLTDVGSSGSFALAKVQVEETYKNKEKALAKSLEDFLNETIIKWIVDENWGPKNWARISFDFTEKTDLELVLKVIDRGLPVSKNALYSQYNIPIPESKEDAWVTPTLNTGDNTIRISNENRDPETRQENEYPDKDPNKPSGDQINRSEE